MTPLENGNVFDKDFYRQSRLEQIKALLERGGFETMLIAEVKGQRLYRSRFIDLIKANGIKRSRICVAVCDDDNHGH